MRIIDLFEFPPKNLSLPTNTLNDMIKIIEFVFRMLVLATFGTVAVFGLIFCALLLWKGRYMDLADECKDLLMYGKKQD